MSQRSAVWFRALCTAALLAIPGISPAVPAEFRIKSKPVAVTVYPQMARVERQGTIRLPAGDSKVVIADLPGSADEDTMRLTAEGPGGMVIRTVMITTHAGNGTVEARLIERRKRIQRLEDRKAEFESRATARNDELKILRGTDHLDEEAELKAKAPNLLEIARGAEAIGKRIRTLLAEGRKDAVLARELDEELALLKQDEEASTPADTSKAGRRQVEADVRLAQAGEVRFALVYLVTEARWAPSYDLTLDPEAKKPTVRFTYTAEISQATGEDWRDVRIELSDARIAEPAQRLHTDLLRDRELRRAGAEGRADSASVAGTALTFSCATGGLAVPAVDETTITSSGAYASHFALKGVTSVPSGEGSRRVTVVETMLQVAVTTVVDGGISPDAFLEGKASYTPDVPLLAGPARMYRGRDFVGSQNLAQAATGDPLTVRFGKDTTVKVVRERHHPATTGFGIWGYGTLTDHYRWLTTVEGSREAPRTVELREHLLVTDRPGVVVTPVDLTAGALPAEAVQPNVVRWNVTVARGRAAKVRFGFDVSRPAGVSVPVAG